MKYFDFLDNREEKLIQKEIDGKESSSLHGIIVVNIDNFIIVNEMYGRKYGDEILQKLIELFTKTFRGTDIIVKLRGDEFVVFTRDIKDIYSLELLAAKLLDTIASVRIKEAFYLTASIGMAIYPFHGHDYSELKNKAYQAMLRVKGNGKNSYRLYDSARTKALYFEYVFDKPAFEKKCERKEYFSSDIGERYMDICTSMFHVNEDSISALQAIMELSCLYLGFSRVYLYSSKELNEVEKQRLRYANSGYEFAKDNSIKDALKADLHARLRDEFKSISLIDNDDESVDREIQLTLKEDGISQILYFPVYHGDEFVAAGLFENMGEERVKLSEEELKKLSEQFGSIHSYFINSYAKKFSRENIIRLDMFQNIDACIYIVDADTHCIEFANRKALSFGGAPCIGEHCYEALCNRTTACDDCPLKKMDRNDSHASWVLDGYNYMARQWNHKMYSWMDVHENKNKAVIIGIDISDYINS